jgi:hypothetical protein
MKNFGTRFSLYPMADGFIDIILGALERTDTSAVYSATDAISTVYRGPLDSVIDALRGLFINAYADGVHMAVEGEIYDDIPASITVPEHIMGEPNMLVEKSFQVKCRLKLSPDGSNREKGLDFIRNIFDSYDVLFGELSISDIAYAVKFEGDVVQMFAFLKMLCEEAGKQFEGFSLHYVMNCNSPTAE